MLKLNNISYSYPNGTPALCEVNLTIGQGVKCAVLGSNGAGKSSLFTLLLGLIKPLKGEYHLDDQPVEYNKRALLALRRRIGIVFQDPDHQLFTSSVYEEVAFGLSNLGYPVTEVRQRVEETLRLLHLEELQQRPPHLLSFGQKKRVVIAAIIAMNPDAMVFDEPLSGLDPESAQMVTRIFEELHQQGKTLIVSTHNVDFAWSWAQQIILMKAGQIEANGRPEEILTNTELMKSCKLRQPVLVDLYQRIQPQLSSGHYPRSVDELSQLITAAL
ncbi:MAG: ABC transporter ATP-binding protein [Bacteroidota bacterium]|nr:ABC transporter ATP-binding protein [Bacteroidota bacterium]